MLYTVPCPKPSKGPFTLGGIPAGYRAVRYFTAGCCVYIEALNWREMESGMQMSLRQQRVWVHETLQTRDHRGEFHTLVRELHIVFPVGGRIQHLVLFDG